MTTSREALIDRMIALYGYEHPMVINFTILAESWQGDDEALRTLVESFESCPQY